jgi:cell division protein ZapE
MPLIELLTKTFNILNLTSEQDYRKINARETSMRILFPNNAINQDKFLKNISDLTSKYAKSSVILENFGREIIFHRTYGPILLSDFNELCTQDLSYSDYITICQKFDIIIIKDVPLLNSNDIATRFINLIDNIYFYHKLLFALMLDSPEKLYTKKLRELEFSRTVSRIIEMNDESYITTEQNILNRLKSD